jgi:hypothetical protein
MALRIGTPDELGLAPGRVESFYRDNWPKRTPLSVPGHYSYLYRSSYDGSQAEATTVAVDGSDGEIVAALAARQRSFLLPDQRRVRGAEMSTWLVRADHRAGGAGVKVLTALRDRFDFCLGASITPEAKDVYLRLGFRWRPALPRFIYAPDWIKLGEFLSEPRLAHRTALARRTPAARSAPAWHEAGAEAIATDVFDDSRSARFERSAAAMQWRYASNPFFQYRTVVIETGRSPACLVFRVEEFASYRAIRVVDFIGQISAVVHVPQVLQALCDREGANCVDFFCSHVAARDAFMSSAWFCVPEEESVADFPHLLAPPARRSPNSYSYVYWIHPASADALGESQLFITKQDCDMDRLAVVTHG